MISQLMRQDSRGNWTTGAIADLRAHRKSETTRQPTTSKKHQHFECSVVVEIVLTSQGCRWAAFCLRAAASSASADRRFC